MRASPILLVLALSASVAASGCSKSNASRDTARTSVDRTSGVSGQSTSLMDMIDAGIRARRAEINRPDVDLQEGALNLPAGWKETIDDAWKHFYYRHEDWPKKREAWLALGEEAEKILVENLIRFHVVAWDHGSEREVRRAETEILKHRGLASIYLVEALASGYGDDVVRNIVGELLARVGPMAVPEIEHHYKSASARGRRSLARSLKRMRSASTLSVLSHIAQGDDPWETRIEAIQGLGDLKIREAIPALLICLRDDDPSVRKFAARCIAMPGDSSFEVVEGLIGCMERSLEETQLPTVRRCHHSLKVLTGQNFRADPRVWRAWLERRQRRG